MIFTATSGCIKDRIFKNKYIINIYIYIYIYILMRKLILIYNKSYFIFFVNKIVYTKRLIFYEFTTFKYLVLSF